MNKVCQTACVLHLSTYLVCACSHAHVAHSTMLLCIPYNLEVCCVRSFLLGAAQRSHAQLEVTYYKIEYIPFIDRLECLIFEILHLFAYEVTEATKVNSLP